MNTENNIRNRVSNKGTASIFSGQTPHQVLHSRKPNIFNVRIIGTKEHVLKDYPKRKEKFIPKTGRGIHLGYDTGNAQKVYIPDRDDIKISRDVTFSEELVPHTGTSEINLEEFQNGDATTKLDLIDRTTVNIPKILY